MLSPQQPSAVSWAPAGLALPKKAASSLCPAGIEPQGNTVLQPAHFTVQTVDAGVGEVLVYIEDPEGHTEEVWRGHWGEKGFV